MQILEGALKALALPVVTAVLGLGYVQGWGPYGFTKPLPVCGAQPPCIIVAGLDGDVRYLPSGADASLVDLDNESVTRLVVWLREELPRLDADEGINEQRAAASVLKYPREIAIGEPGTPNEIQARERALARAVEIGVRAEADLVVIGAVDGQSYQLAFIDPAAPPAQLVLTRYLVADSPPAAFGRALRDSLGPIEAPQSAAASAAAARGAAAAQTSPAGPAEGPTPLPPQGQAPTAQSQLAAVVVPSRPRPESPSGPVAPGAGPPPSSAPASPAAVVLPPPAPAPALASAVNPEDILRRARPTSSIYPERALERGREGVVRLHCIVEENGRADCSVFSEEPEGWGFGAAALEAARSIRVRTENDLGQSTVGVSFYETVRFRVE